MMSDDANAMEPATAEELEFLQMECDSNLTEIIDEDDAHQVDPIAISPGSNNLEMDISDGEDHDILTQDEEEALTKQFLNGELTFSEYSSRMDRGDDGAEGLEPETSSASVSKDKEMSVSSTSEMSQTPKYRRKKKKRILPLALQGLMGEANLKLIYGEPKLAFQMCMEIIRQVPSAPEPYETLATIYEKEDPEKALQFSLIAAHLRPKDSNQWLRLASHSLESGDVKQALTCYSKAIQANPKDVSLYKARAELQEKMGDTKGYIKGYVKLLHCLGPEEGESLKEYAKMLTKIFIDDNNYDQALESMEQIFIKCPNLVTLEEVNIMTDLLITVKRFNECLKILEKYTKISIKYKEDDEDFIEHCDVPDDLIVDLKAKFLVALVDLNYVDLVDKFSPRFLAHEDPEISGDLFLDIAEALMLKKHYIRALDYLRPLVNSNYSLAAVWLRYAECWVGCKDLKKAILSYEIVTKLSPQHLDARLQLSNLYKYFKLYDLAVEIIQQNPEEQTIDPGVLYHQTNLYYKMERYQEFLQNGLLLMSRHCANLRSKDELRALMRPSVRLRVEALRLQRLSRAESLEDDDAPVFSTNNIPSPDDEFKLFLKMCKVSCKLKKYGLLERIAFTGLTSKTFESKTPYIIFICLLACIYNSDFYYGYNIVRDFVRDTKKPNPWNLLNIVIQRADDARHNRFIMRLLGRDDVFSYLHILHANNCLVSGTYKYALNDYISLFKVNPNALLALLIAVTFLQMSCQKFAVKKHRLVTQAYSFFKKYELIRQEQQESNYNFARALHQLGLLSGAVYFYKLVLQSPVNELIHENSELLDLKKEAAFNLHLIYKQSGNLELARIYIDEYIVI